MVGDGENSNCLRFAHPAEANRTLEARKMENLHLVTEWNDNEMGWNGTEWQCNRMERNGMEWNGMKSFVQNRCKIRQKRSPWLSKLVLEDPKIEVGEVPDAHDQPRGAQESTAQERPRDVQETH